MTDEGRDARTVARVVIVQVVRTTWTKASRGQPGASARAAVPLAFAVDGTPSGDRTDAVLVETIEADETDGFTTVHRTEPIDALPVRIAHLDIALDGERLVVTRRVEKGTGWPARSPAIVAFRLGVGEWGRIVRNHRFSGYSQEWSYEKTVVSIAHLATVDRRVFVDTEPDRERDEQARLF